MVVNNNYNMHAIHLYHHCAEVGEASKRVKVKGCLAIKICIWVMTVILEYFLEALPSNFKVGEF